MSKYGVTVIEDDVFGALYFSDSPLLHGYRFVSTICRSEIPPNRRV